MKIILHLCASDLHTDSIPYEKKGYKIIPITKEIGVENLIAPENIYGIIANPPCTEFSRAAWQIKKQDRNFTAGMKTVSHCLKIIWQCKIKNPDMKFWVLENPEGYLRQFLGKPAATFQPWQYGDTSVIATKRTNLWGYFKMPKQSITTRTIPPKQKTQRYKQNLFPDKRQTSTAWGKLSQHDRSNGSQEFWTAFQKANQ